MALDTATATLLAQFGESGAKPIHEMTPAEARALGAGLAELYGAGPDMLRVAELSAPSEDGRTIPLRLLIPREDPRALIVFYHGGGWTMGALDEFDTLARTIADRTGCAVVLVDYRLAPDSPFPAAADDAWDALRWIDGHMQELVGHRVPLVVAGDSAGSNLAAVVARKARDAGAPQLDMQILVCPVTDCATENDSYLEPSNQLMLSRDTMLWYWNHYVPNLADRENPDASPSKAADLSGLPPAIVVLAEHDVLRQEGEEYARLLEEAGGVVECRLFEGQMHDFFIFVNVLPGSAAAIEYVADALDRRLGGQSDDSNDDQGASDIARA